MGHLTLILAKRLRYTCPVILLSLHSKVRREESMSQDITPRCFYCLLPVNPMVDDFCPHCHYPASPAKEEEYLKSALVSLQQAMSYGGAQLKVIDLFQR